MEVYMRLYRKGRHAAATEDLGRDISHQEGESKEERTRDPTTVVASMDPLSSDKAARNLLDPYAWPQN